MRRAFTLMKTIELMLRDHPRADQQRATFYAEAIAALATCLTTCTACADACLAETEHLHHLRRCIRTDLDCADVCGATLRVITRQTETPSDIVHAQLHACVLACRICADECESHSDRHDHCRVCAEACRHCQERCNLLLGEISSAGTAEGLDAEEFASSTR
jgi:hypothetical protein